VRLRRLAIRWVPALAASMVVTLAGVPPLMADVSPVRIRLDAAPPTLIANGEAHDSVYIQIIDEEGTPVPAARDTSIFLRSSNPFVVGLPSDSVIVAAGDSYAIVTVMTSRLAGTATLTALSSSHEATVTIQTVEESNVFRPTRLVVSAEPSVMIAGADPRGRLTVSVTDDQGNLTPASENIPLTITSSAADVASPVGTAMIRRGEARPARLSGFPRKRPARQASS
jgi:hypothetical protein